MNNELNNAFRKIQKEEAKNVFYGENDVISRPGFDSIESFDKGIRDVRTAISDYDALILENQNKLKEVVNDLDLFKSHPEIALPGQVEKLNNQYVSFCDKQKEYLEKQTKEKKNLEEIMEAKKEFVREMRAVYKNQAKDKVKILDEYNERQKEMRALEAKINIGTANELDKVRYETLKNEIIPDIDNMLHNNVNKDTTNDENVVENNEKMEEYVKNISELSDVLTADEVEKILSMKADDKTEDLENLAKAKEVSVGQLVEAAKNKKFKLDNNNVPVEDATQVEKSTPNLSDTLTEEEVNIIINMNANGEKDNLEAMANAKGVTLDELLKAANNFILNGYAPIVQEFKEVKNNSDSGISPTPFIAKVLKQERSEIARLKKERNELGANFWARFTKDKEKRKRVKSIRNIFKNRIKKEKQESRKIMSKIVNEAKSYNNDNTIDDVSVNDFGELDDISQEDLQNEFGSAKMSR